MRARTSAIVVTWNSAATIAECVRSIRREVGSDGEIIVVDNASSDDSVEVATAVDCGVLPLRNGENVGFARAVNTGVSRCQGERVLILNPDAVMAEGALAAMHEVLDDDPRVGAVGPALVKPSGRLDYHAARNVPRLRDQLFEGLFLSSLFPWLPPFDHYVMGTWNHAGARSVPCLSGACLLVRRTIFESVGGLHEGFFLFYEDVEWCVRIREHGHTLWYEPGARVTHLAHQSIRQDPFLAHRHLVESARLFYEQVVFHHRPEVVDSVWAIVAAARFAIYALASMTPFGRRYRGLPSAYLRLLLYVMRTFGQRAPRARVTC